MSKSWSLRNKHNLHSINNTKFKSMTVYGAIGSCLHRPFFYYVQKPTNKIHYKQFILKLKDHIRGDCVKPIIYFDGHPAHKGVDVIELVKQYFDPFLCVAHSSNFNSIETVWSVAKRNFRKLMQMQSWAHDVSEATFIDIVKQSIETIKP